MTRMTGGGALVEMLRRNGVDTMFALPGVQNDALFVAFYDAGEALRVIHTRHEQGVAYMAYGYARSSGKTGAYAVVPGPGLLNTTAALSTAYATNTPVLCISGQIPSDLIGRGFGLLHEIPDQLGILRTLTKWASRIDHPTQAGKRVNEAFRQMRDGRPRPVALEMPLDVMALETEVVLPETEPTPAVTMPDPELIEKAAGLLAEAKKPLLFVGGGAIGAAEEVLAIGEMLQAPVVSYTGGKGIVSDRHYLAQSAAAGHELWRDADVVLAVGTRLHQPQVRWGIDADLKLIRIDIDPTEITRILKPALGIVADAQAALAALHRALERRAPRRPSRRDELEALKSRTLARLADVLGPQCEYLQAIRAELPDDGIYVEDLTQVGYVGRVAFPIYQPAHLHPQRLSGHARLRFCDRARRQSGATRSAGRLGLGRRRLHVQRAGAVDRGQTRDRRRGYRVCRRRLWQCPAHAERGIRQPADRRRSAQPAIPEDGRELRRRRGAHDDPGRPAPRARCGAEAPRHDPDRGRGRRNADPWKHLVLPRVRGGH